LSSVLIYAIKGYQLTFGRMLPRVCRFEPTCSTYAIDALREHGPVKGMLLSLGRILRCNPFCTGGWDPVPKRNQENG
jgi:putative membrane protein insertion efficiency factor